MIESFQHGRLAGGTPSLTRGIEPVKIGYYRAGTDERSAQIFDNHGLSGGKVGFPMTFPAEGNQVFLDIIP
jgi:hypothetical protein